jgi:hypothetical protein
MAARSSSQLVYTPEASALEMRWVSEGGHLRSRWSAASRTNQFEPAEVRAAPKLRVTSPRTASVKVEAAWLLGMLCWLIAFLL